MNDLSGPTVGTRMLPVLPIKNLVLFPHLMLPLSVGRPRSLGYVEQL